MPEQTPPTLLLQSHFARGLLDARDKHAIFELLAARIHSATDGSIVTVSEFSPEHGTLTLRVVQSTPSDREQLALVLGRDPVGLVFTLPAETRRAWIVGELARLSGGLHELVFGQLPVELCEQITRVLGLGDIYAMACSYQEDILGTVAVLTRRSGPFANQQLIESLIAQTGLALRRARSEEQLRRAEERLRLAQELSLDAFTILDAVRDERGTIVDFRWSFVNPIAGRILRHDPQILVGKRLLEVLPGNKEESDLFDRYVRVVETGEPHDCEIPYESEGIQGWFRNMAVRSGDGVAVSFSDISERKRAVAAMMEANERLREADHRKDEFLAVLSHELRNPLAAISSRTATRWLAPSATIQRYGQSYWWPSVATHSLMTCGGLVRPVLSVTSRNRRVSNSCRRCSVLASSTSWARIGAGRRFFDKTLTDLRRFGDPDEDGVPHEKNSTSRGSRADARHDIGGG